jgi:CO/xanthine dehydrogenase Mo-binding subunit
MASGKIVKSKRFFEQGLIETIGEVSTEQYKSWHGKNDFKYVGKAIPRKDGYDKVSGTAAYTFDIQLPHLAYAKTLRCPLPHAKIKRIDYEKARQLPGVLAILTYQNSPEIKWYYTSFLFDPHLRYEGDEIACLAAESEAIAEEAIRLIEVEYEALPFVIDQPRR